MFRSHPARIGFTTAIALKIMGRPGAQLPYSEQIETWSRIKEQADGLLSKLAGFSNDEIADFVDFHTLSELMSVKSGKVGEFEREFFLKAFQVLIDEEFNHSSMTPCGRAY